MQTVLVNCSRRQSQIQVNIGYAVIMNSLNFHGIEYKLVDLIPIDPDERIEHFRKNLLPERAIYAFGITIGNGQIREAEECAKIIKEANPDNIIIYGGPLATSSPKILAANCLCDYVLAGEAENTFPELLKRILNGEKYPSTDEIPGLYYKEGDVIKGRVHKKIGTLTELSNPDYGKFDMDFYIGYLKEIDQSWEIMASRGCAANCAFCYKMLGSGISVRSVDSVLDEMEMIIKNYDLHKFWFLDDDVLAIKEWYQSFLKRKRERGLDFKFIVQARIDVIDEDLVREGAENGLICISPGIESINQSTLDKVRKQITIEQIREKIALIKRYDVGIHTNFIIGFEDDTEEDWQNMYDFILNNLPGQVKLNILTPLPNTFIYKQAKKRNLIGDEYAYILNMGDLYFEIIVNMTSLPKEKLQYWYEKIHDVGSRKVAFPKSEKYLNKFADHYYRRYPPEKRL